MLSALLACTAITPSFAQSKTSAANGKLAAIKPAFPTLHFDKRSNGEHAITKLGAHLPAVAAYYGKTPGEFIKQLRQDKSAWIDQTGHLLIVEKALTVSGSTLAPSGAIYAPEQTFSLHSRPGSKRKIYLDFNGHATSGTQHNSYYGISTIYSPAFDLDGVPGSFNAAELAMIQNVWRRVAEDYAPFDVDVTTEEPPADQMVRLPFGSDDTFGMRVVITKDFTASTSKPCGCGGFAYVGAFDEMTESRKPAFVFTSGHDKYIAEAVSHEVGHTVGLTHDGYGSDAYYGGHGSGAASWAPIMGVGYNRELVQFSNGQYAGANNLEDDFQVMQNNGIAFAADDFGNTSAFARVLTPTLVNGIATSDARGLIETPTDVDVFKFNSDPGIVTITAAPFELSPNLDIMLEVRDGGGVLLASANAADVLHSSLSFTAPRSGSYYVSVLGAGQTTGASSYTDYGSLGRYNLRVAAPLTATPPVCALRVTVPQGNLYYRVSFSSTGSYDTLGPIQSYRWDFGDGSAPGTGANTTHGYHESGSYLITLTVTNSAGMSTSCQTPLEVDILDQ